MFDKILFSFLVTCFSFYILRFLWYWCCLIYSQLNISIEPPLFATEIKGASFHPPKPNKTTKINRKPSPSILICYAVFLYAESTFCNVRNIRVLKTWVRFSVYPQNPNPFQTSICRIQQTVQYFLSPSKERLVYLLLRIGQDLLIWLPTGVVCLSGEYKSLMAPLRMTSLPPSISSMIEKKRQLRTYYWCLQ